MRGLVFWAPTWFWNIFGINVEQQISIASYLHFVLNNSWVWETDLEILRIFSNILGPCSLHTVEFPYPVVTTENVFRHCQMSLVVAGGKGWEVHPLVDHHHPMALAKLCLLWKWSELLLLAWIKLKCLKMWFSFAQSCYWGSQHTCQYQLVCAASW